MSFFKQHPVISAVIAIALLMSLMLWWRWQSLRIEPVVAEPGIAAPIAATPVQPTAAAVPAPTAAPIASPQPVAQPVTDWRSAGGSLKAVLTSLPAAVADALAGDARAKYHLARTLMVCQLASNAGRTGSEDTWADCRAILASPALERLAGADGAAGWAPLLADAVQAGDPRAYGYAALYCTSGSPCDPVGGGDRVLTLAAAQTRAGLAIRSGDPEAMFHAGLAIASPQMGRNPVRGAAWMLAACERGYDCTGENALNQELICPRTATDCLPGASLRDRLQARLGAADYARAYALAQQYQQDLDSGDVPERAVVFGSR